MAAFCLRHLRMDVCGDRENKQIQAVGRIDGRAGIGRQLKTWPRLRGSYTVEAALLMTMILPILITSLYMSAWLADCVRMSAVLGEGSLQMREEEGEGRNWLKEQGGFFALHPDHIHSEAGGQIRTSLREKPSHSRYGAVYDAEFCCAKRDPVSWVRRIRRLQSLRQAAG